MSEHAVDTTSVVSARPHFLKLSAVVGIVLVAIVTVATFGLYQLGQVVETNGATIDRLAAMADDSRITQVTFKTEVQEWKNTLLRGHAPEDYETYHGAFIARRNQVAEQLQGLAAKASELSFPAEGIAALQAMHKELDAGYDSALALFKADDPLSIRAVDSSVRGRDRPVNDGFDKLVADVKTFADQRRVTLREEIASVAASTRLTLYVSLAIGLAVLLVAVFIGMRAIRGR